MTTSPAIQSATPSRVRAAKGEGETKLSDQSVSFRMSEGGKSQDFVWDKKSDALFVRGADGKLAPAKPEVQNAVLARLGEKDLKAVRNGSTYDQMQKDMFQATAQKTAPKTPTAEKPVDTKSIYEDRTPVDSKAPTPVKTAPTPTSTTPVKSAPNKPVTALKKDAPVQTTETPVKTAPTTDATKTTPTPVKNAPTTDATKTAPTKMTKQEFVDELGGKSISAKSSVKGVNVAMADLNGDGVVQGKAESAELFKQLNKIEKAKTGPDTVELEKPVADALNGLRAAPETTAGKPRYSKTVRDDMNVAITAGSTHGDSARFIEPGAKDYLGRKLSPEAVIVPVMNKETTEVVHDPKLGFLKRQNDGALVPMSAEEVKAFASSLQKPDDNGPRAPATIWNRMHPNDTVSWEGGSI